MQYKITVQKDFRALQGLVSPIRNAKRLPSLQPPEGYDLTLNVTVTFDENQLNQKGWFVDTDSLDEILKKTCQTLSSQKWTEYFGFRPTFEQVVRWVYHTTQGDIPQLSSVSIHNRTLGTTTEFGFTIEN